MIQNSCMYAIKCQVGGSTNWILLRVSSAKVSWQNKELCFLNAAFLWFTVDSLSLIHILTFY